MLRTLVASQNEVFIFADDDFSHWEYEGTDHCWRGQFFSRIAKKAGQTSFCVARNREQMITNPVLNMIRSIKGWANEVMQITNPFAGNGLYPLAYIDGRLYFTNNPNHITLNDKWGNGTIYYIRKDNIADEADTINTDIDESTTKIFKLGDGDPTIIKTSELAGIIDERSSNIIAQFVDHCRANGKDIKVSYQDEHMKSILSIILCMQTIGYFIKKIGLPYTLEFLVERYYAENGKRDNLGANQPSSEERDEWLTSMANELVDDILYDNGIEGSLIPVVSKRKGTLTHWRVLTFECAGKRLNIYPDGGFMNGWFIHNAPGKPRHEYDLSTLTYDTEVNIFRNQDIKFDVTIEDC